MTAPRARTSDPFTSKQAGKRADLVGSRGAVLKALRARRFGATQSELERLPELSRYWSPSRIRTAVSELEAQGLVVATDRVEYTRYRRLARVYEAVKK